MALFLLSTCESFYSVCRFGQRSRGDLYVGGFGPVFLWTMKPSSCAVRMSRFACCEKLHASSAPRFWESMRDLGQILEMVGLRLGILTRLSWVEWTFDGAARGEGKVI